MLAYIAISLSELLFNQFSKLLVALISYSLAVTSLFQVRKEKFGKKAPKLQTMPADTD